MALLTINNLKVSCDNVPILKGIDLNINDKEIHALLGPNGNGKSTLLQTIMGHPKYQIDEGSIEFNNVDILKLSVDKRSQLGLFLAMQYPPEIAGVSNSDFMRSAINSHSDKPTDLFSFIKEFDKSLNTLGLSSDFAHRFINEGFSGGEKKRNEIVQLLTLQPKMALLDEIDSGLDVDALKIVADAINSQRDKQDMGLLLVSHYARFYQLVKPDFAHVMIDGKIVCSGDSELIDRIDTEGYEWLLKEMDLRLTKPATKLVYSLGSCGIKEAGKQQC